MLTARDIPNVRMVEGDHERGAADERTFDARIAELGIDNVNLLFSHERVTFRIHDAAVLRRKFLHCLAAAEAALDGLIRAGRKPVVVQELGGFLSVIATFHAARRRGIDNWFLEPAFFRGRLFFLHNAFHAFDVSGPIAAQVSPEVARYIDETLAQKAIVIPKKDRHQYASVLGKITNRRNIRRLFEKLYDKHVLGKRQEFGHIGVHVGSHLEMAWNALRMRGLYTPLADAGRFVYYPLHVPADMALTLRSPQYLDQLALVDYLLRIVPATHRIAIKEHPAQVGALPSARIRALKRRYDNLVVLPPTTNNYAVLERASAIVSVNSKSGAEALLVGKPVLVLGDAFYSRCELVTRVAALADLPSALEGALRAAAPDPASVRGYFQTVYDRSLPGELYVADADNVDIFAGSLIKAVLQRR